MSYHRAAKDTDPMPFGAWKGVPMIDVPADYLIWLKDHGNLRPGSILSYIIDKEKFLREEIKNKKTT